MEFGQTQTLHGTAIYADQLTPSQPPWPDRQSYGSRSTTFSRSTGLARQRAQDENRAAKRKNKRLLKREQRSIKELEVSIFLVGGHAYSRLEAIPSRLEAIAIRLVHDAGSRSELLGSSLTPTARTRTCDFH